MTPVPATDLSRAGEFYGSVLGWEVPDIRSRIAWFPDPDANTSP